MGPLLLLPALLLGPAAAELLTLLPDRDTSAIPACQDDTVLSCILVSVDVAALEGEQLLLPGGVMVSLKDRPLEDAVTFANSDGVEATFSYNDNEVYGEVEIENGTIFTLEPCSSSFPGCHVLKQEDMEMMSQLEAAEESAWSLVEGEGRRALTALESRALSALEQQGIDDTTTVVTYSLKVYYTPQFAAATNDIPLFVDQMIAVTNQGYINSNIPLRVALACIEAADLDDVYDSYEMLSSFKKYKSSVAELRQSADAAMLLVNHFSLCGMGYIKAFKSDLAVTVAMKSCALGYFTPGHELGHNFGAQHDAVNSVNSAYPYGLGKHMGFIGSRGYRSVMAYEGGKDGKKYTYRVNYWSNPNIKYRGMKTGTAKEDNARLLTQNRFIFAAQGDESDQTCTPTASPTTQAPTTTSASGSGSGSGSDCFEEKKVPFLKKAKKVNRAGSAEECQELCQESEDCEVFSFLKHRNVAKKGTCMFFKIDYKVNRMSYTSGPKFSDQTCTPTASPTTQAPTTTSASGSGSGSGSGSDCFEEKKVPFLKKAKKVKMAGSAEECQELCQESEDCEVFSFLKNRNVAKKGTCMFFKIDYKVYWRPFTSGPKFC